MREGIRGRGVKEVMCMILGFSLIADLCLLFQNTTDRWGKPDSRFLGRGAAVPHRTL
jgi:hypothetical protein